MFYNFMGIAVTLAILVIFSENRKKINKLLVFRGLVLQAFLPLLVLKTSLGSRCFVYIIKLFNSVGAAVEQASLFLFGNLGDASGPWGNVLIIKIVPLIVFFSAFIAILFFFKILQAFVIFLSTIMRPLIGSSPFETLASVTNAFLTQGEVFILLMYYLPRMTRSELFVVMVSGLSTMGIAFIPIHISLMVDPLYLFVAFVMSIPGSIIVAKILVPEVEDEHKAISIASLSSNGYASFWDAIRLSAIKGFYVAGSAFGFVLSIISFVAMINAFFFWLTGCTMIVALGSVFKIFGHMIGIAWHECSSAGQLFAQRLIAHEIVAYKTMATLDLLPRTRTLMTVALAGFTGFSSVGVQVGILKGIIPERMNVVIPLAYKALFAGTLVTLLNAAIIGLII